MFSYQFLPLVRLVGTVRTFENRLGRLDVGGSDPISDRDTDRCIDDEPNIFDVHFFACGIVVKSNFVGMTGTAGFKVKLAGGIVAPIADPVLNKLSGKWFFILGRLFAQVGRYVGGFSDRWVDCCNVFENLFLHIALMETDAALEHHVAGTELALHPIWLGGMNSLVMVFHERECRDRVLAEGAG